MTVPTRPTSLKLADPSGSLIGGLVGLAGVLGLLSRWQITADQAVAILGFAFMVAAAIRTWIEKGRKNVDLDALLREAPVEIIEAVLEDRRPQLDTQEETSPSTSSETSKDSSSLGSRSRLGRP